MFITLTGKLGSGKSTVAKLIQKDYGYEIYSTGTVQRSLAEKMGITTLELNKRMKEDPSYDHVIDDETTRLSEEKMGENILFDSRLAFHFVRESFKVFAYVSPYEAADRVMGADRGSVEHYQNREDARNQLLERSRVENERFGDIYHLNNLDYDNYNLIIDTTWVSPAEVETELMRVLGLYQENPNLKLLCFSPKSVYPLKACADLDIEKEAEAEQCLKAGKPLEPVKLIYDGVFHYVAEGMETVAAALKLGINYVTCVMAEDGLKIPAHVSLGDYETLGGFTYKDIPGLYEK